MHFCDILGGMIVVAIGKGPSQRLGQALADSALATPAYTKHDENLRFGQQHDLFVLRRSLILKLVLQTEVHVQALK